MKSRTAKLALALVIPLTVATSLIFSEEREPMHNGKPLGYWLDRLQWVDIFPDGMNYTFCFGDEPPDDTRLSATERTAADRQLWKSIADGQRALEAIGTNAIPHLIARLQTRDSRLRLLLRECSERVGIPGHDSWQPAVVRRGQALQAFWLLHTNAQASVPQLLCLTTNQDTNVQFLAWYALYAVDEVEFAKLKYPPIMAPPIPRR